jgi:hypothetical protein
VWGKLDDDVLASYEGLLGHYHISTSKWDPGPLDFAQLVADVGGARSLPIAQDGALADLPAAPAARRAALDAIIAANESAADGGFYPVGPLGETRLWHGGIHVVAPEGAPLHAPFPGRIVAARLSTSPDVGSTSFVLIRHDLAIGPHAVRFFTLFFHLLDEGGPDAGGDRPVWWAAAGRTWRPGYVVTPELPVRAGDLIGRVGQAGPRGARRAQVHLEAFADREILAPLGMQWDVLDGHGGGRFCTVARVDDAIDANHDGVLTADEVRGFFHNASAADRAAMRRLVVLSASEWNDFPPTWHDTLSQALPGEQDAVSALYETQIVPSIWWTEQLPARLGLPRSGEVFHYHPIELIAALDELIDRAGPATGGVGAFDERDASALPASITNDRNDPRLDDFATPSDLAHPGAASAPVQPSLADMAAGFSDDE